MMAEFYSKSAIAIYAFLLCWIISPAYKWVKGQFADKNAFKEKLGKLEVQFNTLDNRTEKTDKKVDALHEKLDTKLSDIASTLEQVKINTAVNTSKIDSRK